MAKLEKEAHRLADRALEQQERVLAELRVRTGTLLTASSFITSFLGAQALARGGFSIWIVFAAIAFGVSTVLCIYVLLPKDDLVFVLDGRTAYRVLIGVREDDDELDRRLAYWLEAFREANDPTVKRLAGAFEAAGFALLIEIGLLSIGYVLG
jgi:hypothetical protein